MAALSRDERSERALTPEQESARRAALEKLARERGQEQGR